MGAALELIDVDIVVGETSICRGLNLVIGLGETHVLFGPNGSGKSSLLAATMGLPSHRVTAGSIRLFGEPIEDLPVRERALRGLGMAYQRPPVVQGVSPRGLATSLGALTELFNGSALLDLEGLIDRDINAGFSGGETKRWEILKLYLQQPVMCLFDEPETGVDLEHVGAVGAAIKGLVEDEESTRRSALVVAHTGFILDHLTVDVGHLMIGGRLVYSGDPYELFEHIKTRGYTIPADM
ncbi:ATP-binding cassette domain-containing protein [Mycobacterium sp. CVI_P3]|uniref:ATP-binding cassette domain-containing protein n=1 Tax=Mycobacterium pinniadriaticum TaxID=2994102 RepID=A0ABT3SG36_9MYCO|nr:ATP-binding cassette domain-containing protein [Mycobacterium pinniadriaticum]MCX2932041.1 ATP-binding cassette domain-containing protein [Mycobacterium pinniadriaticum]MCX2938465.1 ATP-binding cassette domain-containing protein [Mycobacterium pinniadriaticum]